MTAATPVRPVESPLLFRSTMPAGRMCVDAIAFDMDIESLRANYGDPYNNAYLEIRRVLERH